MAKEKILDIIKSSKTIDSAYDIKINKGQGTNAASATRKDYVDGEIAKQVSKSGDTMTGNLITSGSLVADGVIRTKYSVETYDTSSAYGIRNNISGSSAYIQAGKVDRDVTDQKLILSGWLGTPLTMSKFSMANGVNPQVTWGSTNHDILHRGNLPNAADVGAVSKNGDRMISGNIGFSVINTGISLHPTYSSVTGLYVGNGDGASQDATNIVLKSWYGIGIAPTAGLLPSMTLGQNSVWINARSGDIETIGSVNSNGLYLKHATSNTYTYFDAIPTKEAGIRFRNNGLDRWKLYQNITTESGGNSGSDFVLNAYSDTGSFLATAITVTRSEQVAKFLKVPIVSSAQGTEVNSLTRKDYVDGEIAKQVSKTGDTMTGVLKVNAEIQSLSNHSYRQVVGDYGTFWRNDGTNHYLMLTNVGDPYGTWNSFRPLRTELATGKIYLGTDSYVNNDAQKIFHDQYAPRITQSEYLDTGSDLNNMVMYTGGMVVSRFGSNAANRPPVGSSANTILGFNPTGGYKHQIAFTDGGTIYSRYTNNSASWSNWGKVYTDIYRPTPAEVGAVNKTGDTMTGNLSFSDTGEGVRFAAFKSGNGIYNGTGDGATQDMTNIQIKTWYGIGISPTTDLPAGMTMGQNSIWINARTGAINSIGSVTANGFKSDKESAYWSTKTGHGMSLGMSTDNRTLIGGGGSDGIVVIRPLGTGISTAQTIFEANGTIWNPIAPINASHLTNKEYVDGQVAALLARITALESK